MTTKTDRLALSVSEAAEALGLSRPMVYELMHRPDFPAFRVGRRTLISRSGLERWIEAQANGGEAREGREGQLHPLSRYS